MCHKMPVTSLIDFRPNLIWNSPYLLRTLLLLAAVLHLQHADDKPEVRYQQQRSYYRKPGQLIWVPDLSFTIIYTTFAFTKYIPSDFLTCLPFGDYHNDAVGHAVCNTDPSYAYMENLVRDTIAYNITSLSMNYYRWSGIDGRRPGFHCMRFFIRILNHERNVHVSNLSSTPCPVLSVASLLYPHPGLNRVHIYELPLKQDPRNLTSICPNSSTLEEISLHNNGLKSAPFSFCPTYFRNLTYAVLENQELRLDDRPLFTLSDHLIYLSLHRCALQNLPLLTFVGLTHLQMLNISNNNISSFPNEVFHDLTSLVALRVDNNALTILNMSVFRRLRSLQCLHLSGNQLNSIDGEVAILPSLRVIDLSQNKFTVIRKNLFGDSPSVTFIDVSCNNISIIESGAFLNMSSFAAVNAALNALTHVNPCSWFDDISKLNFLILAYNNITHIDGLRCLLFMQVFNLFANGLSTIPAMRNLISLKLLDLGRNAIHNVSGDEIAPAVRLRELYLDGNEMLELGVFSYSSSIELLELRVNNLTYLPAYCFYNLKSLKMVNLTQNHIAFVGKFPFPEKLKKLGLYDNELANLESINPNLSQLGTLQIGQNNITKFNIYLPSVVYFDISDNPLQNLSLNLCKKMPKLKDIFLEKLGIRHHGAIDIDLLGSFRCDYLRHVSLARNHISKIDESLLLNRVIGGIDYSQNPLKSIPRFSPIIVSPTYLLFDNCSVESIAPMAFNKLKQLTYVGLKANNIKYFPQMSLSVIKYDLRSNPIVCSCHLRWLHRHETRNNYLFTTCLDPVSGSVEVFDLLPLDRLVCQHEVNCAQGCVCFGVNISSASIVKCSSRSLTAIPPNLSPEADVIYLDHNQFRKLHFPDDMDNMAASQVFLQNSEIHFLEQNLFAAFPLLQVIDLSSNELETLNMDVFRSMNDLKKLFLHSNHIHQIYGGTGRISLPHLQTITLHYNGLQAVPETLNHTIDGTSFSNLTLSGNSWMCVACAGPILREWLAQHAGIVSDAAGIRCNKSNLPVLDINTATTEYAKCVNATRTLANTHWGITAGVTVSFVVLLISLVLTYCFRNHILILLYNNFDFFKRRRRELDVFYDVRVIYDETDERVRRWVVDELLQVLETEWGHHVFLVERDMLAGGNHAEEIAQSIRQSRRTLILVSQNFVDNEWAQFAYQAAFQFQIENNLHRLLVVAWEPVETDTMDHSIKVYFETKQVMCRTSRRFWPLLKSKLPLVTENVDHVPNNIQLNLIHNE